MTSIFDILITGANIQWGVSKVMMFLMQTKQMTAIKQMNIIDLLTYVYFVNSTAVW